MKKAELVGAIKAKRAELEGLLADLTPEQMTESGAAGEWSVKDMLAHIAWYTSEEAEFYGETGVPASPHWDLPQDPRNDIVVQESRGRTLDQVLVDFRSAYERMLAVVEALSEDDLATPGRFPDSDEEWPPWRKIAVHTFEHDQEHVDMIRAWLSR